MGRVRPPLVDASQEHVELLAAMIGDGRAALRRLSAPRIAPEVAA